MLVGIAWRSGGGRPPLTLMAVDALVMAVSTFAGSVSGSLGWLHLALIVVWALTAGLLSCLGTRGAVVGTQAMIAVVVFGRFSEPLGPALGLAASVLTGGLAQVLFQSLIRYPSALRVQRESTAEAYRELAKLASLAPETSTLPAAAALDVANDSLSSSTLFGDAAVMTLRSLVNEGHRIRVQLSAVQVLMRQQRSVSDRDHADPGPIVERALKLTAAALTEAADVITGDRQARTALIRHVEELSGVASDGSLELPLSELSTLSGSMALHLSRRISALAGQLRAVAGLAPAAGEGGGLRSRRPHPRTSRPLARLRGDIDQLRANASLQSPAGRHALRLAVVVLIAELLARHLPLQRSYWMVVAAATVLRPDFGATFTRGTERALGTCLGVSVAGALTVILHPAGGATVVLVGVLVWMAYSTFPASWAVGFGFITAVVVFLLNVISPDTLAAASARLVDTLVGGTLGLIAWVAWPTWSELPARQAIADLIEAERAYVGGVLAAMIEGRQADEAPMRSLARQARLARTNAEATVARSLAEPATRRIDAEQSQGALATLRRLIQAVHVIRLDAQEERRRPPLPELAPLAHDLDSLLGIVAAVLRAPPDHHPAPADLPDLRADYTEFARRNPRSTEGAELLAELDEIVDAANGLAAVVGLDPVDPAAAQPSTRTATGSSVG
jgi:uncharacterized membrane protein YccC